MEIRHNVPLKDLTTLRIGGPVHTYIGISGEGELPRVFEYARKAALPVYPLGQGSNVLASDEEIQKVLLALDMKQITQTKTSQGVEVVVEAGVSWDALVDYASEQELWGIENLAGIPGTVGAAPVQNIGAYGTEVKDTILWVEAYDPSTEKILRIPTSECEFSYRDSRFKQKPGPVIVRVAFLLKKNGMPLVAYPDLEARKANGVDLSTPRSIAEVVRSIRALKFPDLREYGTAGSFFKNPVISKEVYATLKTQFPNLPGFHFGEGIKVPLAWILDHVLALRGFRMGPVSLFERQPLVFVADTNAHKADIDALAQYVYEKVFNTTGIRIEREVQTLA